MSVGNFKVGEVFLTLLIQQHLVGSLNVLLLLSYFDEQYHLMKYEMLKALFYSPYLFYFPSVYCIEYLKWEK